MASILELAKQHQDSMGTQMRVSRQAAFGGQATATSSWPMKSYNLGCTPAEIPKMKKFLRSKGVKAEFTSDGRCIVNSEKHKKQITQARGMFDYSGGYDSAGPTEVHKRLQQQKMERQRDNFRKFNQRLLLSMLAGCRR